MSKQPIVTSDLMSLQIAVLTGRVGVLEQLLAERGPAHAKAVVNDPRIAQGTGGFTLLHLACMQSGDAEPMVRQLLAMEAEPDVVNRSGVTPLQYACNRLDRGSAEALLAAGADIGLADKNGYTALMYAVSRSQNAARDDAEQRESMVRWLIDRGAKLDHADAHGRLAIHHAAHQSDESLFVLLKDLGADMHALDNEGKEPLELGRPDWARNLRAKLMSEGLLNAMGGDEPDDEVRPSGTSSGFTL